MKTAVIKGESDWMHFLQTDFGHKFVDRIQEKEVLFVNKTESLLMVKEYCYANDIDERMRLQNILEDKYKKRGYQFCMGFGSLHVFRKIINS